MMYAGIFWPLFGVAVAGLISGYLHSTQRQFAGALIGIAAIVLGIWYWDLLPAPQADVLHFVLFVLAPIFGWVVARVVMWSHEHHDVGGTLRDLTDV